jgi:hypothetical protein
LNVPASVHVSRTVGPVHSGQGDLNAFSISLAGPKARNPRRQPMDELRWLAQRFVHPPGFGKAREVLESRQTVFLDAAVGSGRITAAKMLLWELRFDTGKFHELMPQEEGSGARLNPDHVGEGDKVWLDLTEADRPLWSEVQAEMSSLRAAILENSAYLVVALPHYVEDLRPVFGPFRVRIDRPRAREVLHRHLSVEGVPRPEFFPELNFLKKERSPLEVAEYVQLIGEAREKDPGGDFAAWCATAYQALYGREKEVADLVFNLGQGSQRALLLTTAMLHGAHSGIVHQATASLLRALEQPPEERPVLEHATLDRQLEEIHAELDTAGNVQFKELAYDSAVRTYFWTNMPEVHDRLRIWVGRTADSANLTDNERGDLIERFTEQCLNWRYRSTWVSLVEDWTNEHASARQLKAAALVLQRGLQDEKDSQPFRRQLYEWSRSNLPDSRAEVIVAACRDEMMIRYPDEALVRLHHVARRERGSRAREALVAVVGGDRRFLRQMLKRLTDRSPEARWSADVGLFLEIADPAALTDPGVRGYSLIAESTVRRQLTDGWRLVFTVLPYEKWTPRAREWILHAAFDGRCRDELLDVLVGGAEQSTDILARLYVMTRCPEPQAVVSGLLLQKINAAQGIQFA